MRWTNPRIAALGLVLLLAFAGQWGVQAAEQAGWFCCGATEACPEDNAPASSGCCGQEGCPHQVMPVVLAAAASWVLSGPSAPRMSAPGEWPLDGPVFGIDQPPRLG